ncbi:MAG: hypothetical protein EOO20_00935 [Chryseobacterium sp.]|nr:MAG: hypothetical protein EOO20_00935 [Chryseobacterium sp.]
MRKTIPLLIILILSSKVYAQSTKDLAMKRMKDSLTMVYVTEFAKKQPLLRQGSISYDVIGKGTVESSDANGNVLYKGEVETNRLKANFNVPISSWGKNSINGSVNYLRQHFQFEEQASGLISLPSPSYTRSTVGLSAIYSRRDSVFNRPVIYTAGISAYTDELSSIRRISYTGTIIFPVKQTLNTISNLGVILVVSPNNTIPIPYFGYWHKFTNSPLEINIEIPSNITLRMPFSPRTWATLGTAIDPNLNFVTIETPTSSTDLVHNLLDLRTSLNIEQLIGKKMVVGIRGGVINTLTSRIQKNNAKRDDYIIDNKKSAVPFVNFSISFLPFLKSLK